MYQSFEAPSAAGRLRPRIEAVRERMTAVGIDAYLVPRTDAHQGEYVAAADERLAWLTGFTGSAGLAVIGRQNAALLADGRYTVQAGMQIDRELFEILLVPDATAADWLKANLEAGAIVGFDPWLHTVGEVERLIAATKASGIRLKALPRNLVDAAWGSARPAAPVAPVVPHAVEHAGRLASAKLTEVQAALRKAGQDAAVLTLTDSIAWLLNIRGQDIAHNPVALAFAIVPREGKVELFIDGAKVGANVRGHLSDVADLKAPQQLKTSLDELKRAGRKVRVDRESAPQWVASQLGKAMVEGSDPCRLPKAIKNEVEIEGARRAHLRDGTAMARYLAWLAREAPAGGVDEIEAVRRLEAFRAEGGELKEISFDTISGSGPNGAIVHYRVTTATNRWLKTGELFLLDSGAQYVDGTTDITRTIAVGTPTREMRERFTQVLKGHIAIATLRFPPGTRGIDIDAFARQALWQAGCDYGHGTGHGVGSYLCVHEGPQSISRRGMAELKAGMIISNEPGYYKEGHFGIRIENLVLVTPAEPVAGGDKPMHAFETLTLAPIDNRLIVPTMLTPAERAWIDRYHARVRKLLAPTLAKADRVWLNEATAKLAD